MNTNKNNRQWKLLTTVSAAALMANIGMANAANGPDHPMFWLNLGWHYEDSSAGLGDKFHPAFADAVDQAGLLSVLKPQNQMSYGYGGEGSIAYQPEGSDWLYSLSVRYGRAQGRKNIHQEQAPPTATDIISAPARGWYFTNQAVANTVRFSNATTSSGETHNILDFQAGKDIGLGGGGNSIMNFGIRYAHFTTKSSAQLAADPNLQFLPVHSTWHFPSFNEYFLRYYNFFDAYDASFTASRSFRGLGPSLSWEGSASFAGNQDDGELTIDWGLNAALLFGRQKVKGHHHTRDRRFDPSHIQYGTEVPVTRANVTTPIDRSHSVLAPNIGGFAGLSLQWTNAKISVGYRADYFANAMDGGIDTRKETAQAFFGPFASISIGVSPSDF